MPESALAIGRRAWRVCKVTLPRDHPLQFRGSARAAALECGVSVRMVKMSRRAARDRLDALRVYCTAGLCSEAEARAAWEADGDTNTLRAAREFVGWITALETVPDKRTARGRRNGTPTGRVTPP